MNPLDYILHLDEALHGVIQALGPLSYGLLFLIVFAETGLVIVPFLPGDSLLFAAGTLAGAGMLNIWILIPVLIAAAIIGDSVNYFIGDKVGHRIFTHPSSKWLNPKYLEKTHAFYEKYGGKTLIIARFVPIVRTFAPFVAGMGSMRYSLFLTYNVVGALLWVFSVTLVGYFFGSLPAVRHNFEIIVVAIIIVSIVPAIIEYYKQRRKKD